MIICSNLEHSFYDIIDRDISSDIFPKIKQCMLCSVTFLYKKVENNRANYTIYKFESIHNLRDVLSTKNEEDIESYRHGYEFDETIESNFKDTLKYCIKNNELPKEFLDKHKDIIKEIMENHEAVENKIDRALAMLKNKDR